VRDLQARVEHYNKLIPAIFPEDFPEGFRLTYDGFTLPEDLVSRPDIDVDDVDEKIRPIGILDVEFLSNDLVRAAQAGRANLARDYPCGLKCPGCFSEDEVYGDTSNLMTWQEVIKVIGDARQIGLEHVKFLGPGELIQNPDLFKILDAFRELEIPLGIFTKGAELGDDELAQQIFGAQGINSARDLVQRISEYTSVSILLGFNSFFPDIQDRLVGSANKLTSYQLGSDGFSSRGVANYTKKRDKALVYLVEAGYIDPLINDPTKGRRLVLVDTPAPLSRLDEALALYVWAARRSIPIVIAPTMESGPKTISLRTSNSKRDPEHEKLIDMYMAIYSAAIEEGIMTLKQIREEGVSAYMGIGPCNQVANGLFIRLNGRVQLCPGRSDTEAIYGNTHNSSIMDLWRHSPNYQMGRMNNNWCLAKKDGMPQEVQREVENRLVEKYE